MPLPDIAVTLHRVMSQFYGSKFIKLVEDALVEASNVVTAEVDLPQAVV